MQIEVQHLKRDGAGWEPVARVTIPELMINSVRPDHLDKAALEYAWRRTNNIEGSWSRGPTIKLPGLDGEEYDNPDYSPDVEVIVPLPVDDMNRPMGLRSSMVGDRFIVIDGKHKRVFEVASFGFQRVAP
jgi:hypothetical protein